MADRTQADRIDMNETALKKNTEKQQRTESRIGFLRFELTEIDAPSPLQSLPGTMQDLPIPVVFEVKASIDP